MPTNTTNYNLVKPGTSENADISVINGNMDTIDSQLKINADSTSTKQKAIPINSVAPTSPVDGDLWIDDSVTPNILKRYDGTSTSWVKATPTQASEVGAEPTFTKNTAFNKDFGTTPGTVADGGVVNTHLAEKASQTQLGHVQIGTGINVDANGVISSPGNIGTKSVDETGLSDNYTVRYDATKGNWVVVAQNIDRTPPGPLTNLSAKAGNGQVTLTWANPTDADFSGVKIVRQTGAYPTSMTDGTTIYSGANTSYTDTTVTNGTEYYYRAFTYDTSSNFNTTTTRQEVTTTPQAYHIYGVQIAKSNSNPSTAVTYTDDATGMTAGSSWDSIFPFNAIKPCLYKAGAVNYYLDPNDFTKKADGTTASDITSGNDGDVMIEFPKVWWKITSDANNVYVKLADAQIDSTYLPLAHTKGTTEKDFCYVGAYLGYYSTNLRSLSGKVPTTAQTIGTFRTYAQGNGASYQQMGYYQLLMLQILFLLKYKSLDSQTALGRGYVDGNSSAIATGGTNAKGMYFGETTGKQQMKFAGIEDFWGNLYYWIDGLYSDASWNILIGNQSFNDTGSGYTNYGQGVTANVSGYISDVQGGTETGFIIKASSGSASTYYADGGSLYASSLPVFGGAWASADDAGAFRLGVDGSASDSDSSVGGRLLAL